MLGIYEELIALPMLNSLKNTKKHQGKSTKLGNIYGYA